MKKGVTYLVKDGKSFEPKEIFGDDMTEGWPLLVECVGGNEFGYHVQDLSMTETFVEAFPLILFKECGYTFEEV